MQVQRPQGRIAYLPARRPGRLEENEKRREER